jgi:hypothetical protein
MMLIFRISWPVVALMAFSAIGLIAGDGDIAFSAGLLLFLPCYIFGAWSLMTAQPPLAGENLAMIKACYWASAVVFATTLLYVSMRG